MNIYTIKSCGLIIGNRYYLLIDRALNAVSIDEAFYYMSIKNGNLFARFDRISY